MSELTPPSSHQGTPVRNAGLVDRAESGSISRLGTGPTSSSSGEPSDRALGDSDVEIIKTDGSDAEMDEGIEQEEDSDGQIEVISDSAVNGAAGLTPAQSSDQIVKVGLCLEFFWF